LGQIKIYIGFLYAQFQPNKRFVYIVNCDEKVYLTNLLLTHPKHFMVKFECQIEKWKYLFESHILPYQPNKTLHAHPILLSCYSHNVFTSACYVWTIIWGDCASWMKHFAKCSLNTPLQKKCLSHNLTNKLCAFFLCERI